MSDYPEHDKLSAISDQSQVIGEFTDWAMGKGYIEKPSFKPTQDILAEFFGIDQEKLEEEKRAMLASLRQLNAEGSKK